MVCPECQAEVEEQAAFCQKCGLDLKRKAEEAATDQAEQAEGSPLPHKPTPHDEFRKATAPGVNHGGDDEDDVEEEIWKGSFSKKAMIGQWIVAGVVSVLAIILTLMMSFKGYALLTVFGLVLAMWGLLIAWYGYRRLSVHYTLTSQRLIHEAGLLWRTIDRIELIDIDDVTFRQGPVERMFRIGRIIVISGDKTSPELTLPGIDNVRKVADEIDDARRKERRRRGLHMITQGA